MLNVSALETTVRLLARSNARRDPRGQALSMPAVPSRKSQGAASNFQLVYTTAEGSAPMLERVIERRKDARGATVMFIRDSNAVVDALGPELLALLCQCCIHANRLNALLNFVHLTLKAYGNESAAFHRNVDTVFWLSTGIFKELMNSMDAMVGQTRRLGIDPKLLKGWNGLEELRQLARDALTHKIRNNVSVHIDSDSIIQGLMKMSVGPKPWMLLEADGVGTLEVQNLNFGLHPLLCGLELDDEEVAAIMLKVRDGSARATIVFEELLGELLVLRMPAHGEA
jgi:hypothetical protein